MIRTVTVQDAFKHYVKTEENPIEDLTIYRDVVHGFSKFIMQKVLDGFDVQLSGNNSLGTIGVRGAKVKPILNEEGEVKGVAPNWGATKKLWDSNPEAKEKKQLVYCFNEHSNGIRYNICWFKRKMKLINKELYLIGFYRRNKRAISKAIFEGKEYLVIEKESRVPVLANKTA